jgi:hypothetical protein
VCVCIYIERERDRETERQRERERERERDELNCGGELQLHYTVIEIHSNYIIVDKI